MNLLLSTDQWKGQESFGYARADSWNETHLEGFDLIPSDNAPLRVHPGSHPTGERQTSRTTSPAWNARYTVTSALDW
jgi:hypothetical protein